MTEASHLILSLVKVEALARLELLASGEGNGLLLGPVVGLVNSTGVGYNEEKERM